MKTRFFFDVEAQDLHKEGFAFGYLVANINLETKKIEILEKGECYSIIGAKGSSEWVQNNVLPSLTLLEPYLTADLSQINKDALPPEIVLTTFDLRERFYQIYQRWKKQGAEFWSDVNFPVETNFLSAIVKDGQGTRDFEMPYPLHDASNFLSIDLVRMDYCGVPDLRRHNPLDDCIALAYSLHKYEMEKQRLTIQENKVKLRFLFDVGAQDLHQAGFAFGYVVTSFDPKLGKIEILEKGEVYSILGAQKVGAYVKENALPCLTHLQPYLNYDAEQLQKVTLPPQLVLSMHDLRERFWAIYSKWKRFGAEAWSSDVNFPVETNFLSAIVEDGKGSRDWEMPYPLSDVASLIDVNISRQKTSGLMGLSKGNPLHHALTSSCVLHQYELKEMSLTAPEFTDRIRAAYQAEIPHANHTSQFWKPQSAPNNLTPTSTRCLSRGAKNDGV